MTLRQKEKIIRMRKCITAVLLVFSLGARAQDYHAVEGSPFAGSLGVANNPASILSTPYPWDITLFSTQIKNSTNAVRFTNYSYLSHPDTIGYDWTKGNLQRFAALNYNIHLLNVRLSLGRRQAISFGANLRGYLSARTGTVNYNDSLKNMNQFFLINEGASYKANMVTSSWLELYGTYSRTLWDDEYGRLNAGVTLKLMRGLSGAYMRLTNGTVTQSIPQDTPVFNLATATASYGYSSNYDFWHDNQSTGTNIHNFISHTQSGAAIDLGIEYMVKSQGVRSYNDADDYFDYEWKIGVSLLDLGANKYTYGSQSRFVANPKTTVTDANLNDKFDNVSSVKEFNDSLGTIVNTFNRLQGYFTIYNPARLVINIDRPLPNNFAINGDLTLNLGGNNYGKRLFTKEMTLLALTPRWETKKWGGYLPLTVTTDGKIWLGAAGKAGPLLFGVHNLGTIFSKTKSANGGFYLALVIRPGKRKDGFGQKEDKQYTCPKY
jgi:hypothetical protein